MPYIDGIKLKKLREEKALSQDHLAKISDIDPKTIGRIERGKTNSSPETTRAISAALGVPLSQLLKSSEISSVSEEALKIIRLSVLSDTYAGDVLFIDEVGEVQIDAGDQTVISTSNGKEKAHARELIEELKSNGLIKFDGGVVYNVTSKGYSLIE